MTEREPDAEVTEPDATRKRLIPKIAQIAWGDDKLFALTDKGMVLYTQEMGLKKLGEQWFYVEPPVAGGNVFYQDGELIPLTSPQPPSEQ